jgi:hypothetical protein
MGHHFGSGSNVTQTRMCYKEITKRALQDHNPDVLIGLEFLAEFVKFLRQNLIKKNYRRVIDADKRDPRIEPKPEILIIRVSHRSGPFSVTAPDSRPIRDKTSRRASDDLSASVRTAQFREQENKRLIRPASRVPKAHLAGPVRREPGVAGSSIQHRLNLSRR